MTSDGTNTYKWDAANRLIEIDYPGINNYTQFSYDGLWRKTRIVETTAGSVTSTKQFVWCSDKNRQYQACEERDGSGSLTRQLFDFGQTIGATNYFYTRNHLGSVGEMTDSSSVVRAEYTFSPYGVTTKLQGNVDADFQYAGYYLHSRSGLNFTASREYDSQLNRWVSRDPIEEEGGNNLYSYVKNNPLAYTDPSGTIGVDNVIRVIIPVNPGLTIILFIPGTLMIWSKMWKVNRCLQKARDDLWDCLARYGDSDAAASYCMCKYMNDAKNCYIRNGLTPPPSLVDWTQNSW